MNRLGYFLGCVVVMWMMWMMLMETSDSLVAHGSVVGALPWIMTGILLLAGVVLGSAGRVAASLRGCLSAFCCIYVPGCLALAFMSLSSHDHQGRFLPFLVSGISGIVACVICHGLSQSARAKSDLQRRAATDEVVFGPSGDRLTQCTRCGLQRSVSSTECPHCGHKLDMSLAPEAGR